MGKSTSAIRYILGYHLLTPDLIRNLVITRLRINCKDLLVLNDYYYNNCIVLW